MKLRVVQIAFVLGFAACGGGDDATTVKMGITVAAHCKPGEVRMCPCLGGGKGSQTCDSTGNGFGPCSACNSPLAAGAGGRAGMSGSGGLVGPGAVAGSGGRGGVGGNTVAGGRGGSGGSVGSAGIGAGTGGSSSAGTGGSGSAGKGSTADDGEKPVQLPAVKGVTCGVGLPVQCGDNEKCCKRSLALDTCEPAESMCACEEENCVTVDVRCDGPEDCPQGQQCCAADSGGSSSGGGSGRPRPGGSGFGGRYTGFACAMSCSSPQRQACHAPGECSNQLVCAISPQLASISVCTDPKTLQQ